MSFNDALAAATSLRERRNAARRVDDRSFSFLANLLPQMVWTATPDGAINYVNERWYNYTGQAPEEALGRGWEKIIHPDDLQETLEVWARANLSGNGESVQHRMRRRDGEYRLHITRYAPQLGEDGRVLRWFGTSLDIHDERRSALRLAEAEKRAALSELAHELAHDLNNPLAGLMNLVYIAKSKAETDDARQLIADAEEQVERIAGLVHSILVLERDAAGDQDKYADILDAERLRRRKQEYEAALHLASIVESAQDAIYSKKIDGTIVAWNSAAERLFGFTANEVVGQNVSILMPSGREHEVQDIMSQLKNDQRVEHYETERLTRDGRVVRVSVSVSPVHNGRGEIVGASSIVRRL